MLRAALRLVLIVIIVVAAIAFFVGYRWSAPRVTADRSAPTTSSPVATTGQDVRDQARQAGAKVGEKVGAGAERAGEVLDDTRVTAKLKSKIALDDTLKGSDIGVSTTDHVVTLSGSVANDGQRQRVLALARETEGVTRVDDHLSAAGVPK
jgi:hyperosmotically inducible protein